MIENELKQWTLSGEIFLQSFFRVLQTAKIYQSDNTLLLNYVTDFIHAMDYYFSENDYLDVQIYRERFYLQGEKLKYNRSNINTIQNMLNYLSKRNLNGLRFHASIKVAYTEQIVSFANLLNKAENQKEPLIWLQIQLREENYFWVEIISDKDSHLIEQTVERGEKARWMYSSALTSIQEVAMKISSQKRAGIQQAKRIVQNMVDILIEEDTIFLGMSTIRDYDDYTYTHSVNVALLSMCLGRRIGMSKILLEQLGISGLFHDLGKVVIPFDLIGKPGKLTEEEFEQIKEHPINSVLQIIKINAARDLKTKIIMSPFEHHLMYNLSGYPQIANKTSISLFGRILTITDIFDAMTSPRAYRPLALSPDKVVRIMLDESGVRFDPILLKAFINMLGVYPVGTLLLLDTEELCLVMETPEDDELGRPVVIVLNRDQEGKYSKGDVVDLAVQDSQSGAFRRNIIKSFHPSSYGIQPADFLV